MLQKPRVRTEENGKCKTFFHCKIADGPANSQSAMKELRDEPQVAFMLLALWFHSFTKHVQIVRVSSNVWAWISGASVQCPASSLQICHSYFFTYATLPSLDTIIPNNKHIMHPICWRSQGAQSAILKVSAQCVLLIRHCRKRKANNTNANVWPKWNVPVCWEWRFPEYAVTFLDISFRLSFLHLYHKAFWGLSCDFPKGAPSWFHCCHSIAQLLFLEADILNFELTCHPLRWLGSSVELSCSWNHNHSWWHRVPPTRLWPSRRQLAQLWLRGVM